MTKWTPESAKDRLDQDIQTAHERYQRRLAAIQQESERLQEFTEPTPNNKHATSRLRYLEAAALRSGGLTYRQIGEHFGVSAGRADQMCKKGARIIKAEQKTPIARLSGRAQDTLIRYFRPKNLGPYEMWAGATSVIETLTPQSVAQISKKELMDTFMARPESISEIRDLLSEFGLDLRP